MTIVFLGCGGADDMGGGGGDDVDDVIYSITLDSAEVVANPFAVRTISLSGHADEEMRIVLDRTSAGVLSADHVTLDAQGAGSLTYTPCTNLVDGCVLGSATLELQTTGAVETVAATTTFTLAAPTDVGVVAPCQGTANMMYVQGNDLVLDGTFSSTTPLTAQPSIDRVVFLVANYSAEFQLVAMPKAIVPGVYELAQRAGSEEVGHPGLAIKKAGGMCTNIEGRFQVHEYVADPAHGDVQSVTISFEQACDYLPGGPIHTMVQGCVHYEADAPAAPAAPDPSKVSVEVRSLFGGPDKSATALFMDSSGTVVLDTTVDMFGRAEVALPSGGTLTTIQYTADDYEYIHTYRGLVNGDHVVVNGAATRKGTKDEMLAVFSPPAGVTSITHTTDCGSPGNAVPGRGVLDFYDGCRSSTFSMLSVATFTALPTRYNWQSGLTHSANGNIDVTGVWSPVGAATVTVESVPASSPSLGVSWTMNIGKLVYEVDNAGFSAPTAGTNTVIERHFPGAGDRAAVTVVRAPTTLGGESWSVVENGSPSGMTVDLASLPMPIASAVSQTSTGFSWTESGSGSADVRRLTWRGLTSFRKVVWSVIEPYSATPSIALSLPASHSIDDPTLDGTLQLKGASIILENYDVTVGFTAEAPSVSHTVHRSTAQNTAMNQPF
jgi:hypothetical protein